MATKHVTLELTADEERALAALLGRLCQKEMLPELLVNPSHHHAIGRINAALNARR